MPRASNNILIIRNKFKTQDIHPYKKSKMSMSYRLQSYHQPLIAMRQKVTTTQKKA